MKVADSSISLQKKVVSYFSQSSVHRGASYYLLKAVKNFKVENERAVAQVEGSESYMTGIDWSGIKEFGVIDADCSCAHFEDGHFCKHLWAVILEIDNRRLSLSIPLGWPFKFRHSRNSVVPKRLLHPGIENGPIQSQIIRNENQNEARSAVDVKLSWREVFDSRTKTSVKKKHSSFERHYAGIVMRPDDSADESVSFHLYVSEQDAMGVYSAPRLQSFPSKGSLPFGDASFQAIIRTITAISINEETSQANRYDRYNQYNHYTESLTRKIKTQTLLPILESLLSTGKVFSSAEAFKESLLGVLHQEFRPVQFQELTLQVSEVNQGFLLEGFVRIEKKDDLSVPEKIPMQKLIKFAEPCLFQFENRLGFLNISEPEKSWFKAVAQGGIPIPHEDAEAFLEAALNGNVPFVLPESLNWQLVQEQPSGKVQLFAEKNADFVQRYLFDLKFQYGTRSISLFSSLQKLTSGEEKKVYVRNKEIEDQIFATLPLNLLKSLQKDGAEQVMVVSANLLEFVAGCLKAGVPVEVENRRVQADSDFKVSVSSGLDWFDVKGGAQFSDMWVQFPAILEAISRGESFVPLPDGSLGLMDASLRRKLEKLSAFAESSQKGLRFSQSQGLLLNSLLENELNLDLDAKFKNLRQKIKTFEGLKVAEPSSGFKGKLRKYQKEGLGWLEFLESFGLGGILADDMGLGKTIQCLAFLEGRKNRQKRKGNPSLLLAPKSLLSNWQNEAEKFTPSLKILILAGTEREKDKDVFKKYDLVVTTYQTMLRDIDTIKEMPWDCVIVDEAQAIKNSEALISRASKIIPAKFRLAMTGTPIENSIQDLFSISDFVNPGFLRGKNRTAHLKLSDESKDVLSKAFKPIILRRTKEQVLKDLPTKTEQLISVELNPKQLRTYNQLKKFYQSQLMQEVNEKGIKKSQIQILAALTRLRQAALHPGLIDPGLANSKCAKFEVVLEMLEGIIAEGHRVLIFSQFTSFLGLLKTELNKQKIKYCYLDGKTTNRQEVVSEFKSNSHPVFLMSLKAGGVGLNLVEADYVFLLDPWWNPAVESQAIDRVHRIGQKQAVNAYRFIAKGTVEEKILELQKSKKGISSEILDGQSSLMRNLTATDIENLLV